MTVRARPRLPRAAWLKVHRLSALTYVLASAQLLTFCSDVANPALQETALVSMAVVAALLLTGCGWPGPGGGTTAPRAPRGGDGIRGRRCHPAPVSGCRGRGMPARSRRPMSSGWILPRSSFGSATQMHLSPVLPAVRPAAVQGLNPRGPSLPWCAWCSWSHEARLGPGPRSDVGIVWPHRAAAGHTPQLDRTNHAYVQDPFPPCRRRCTGRHTGIWCRCVLER